jgi:2',3'-cyclic-nucleotide 2'-phosphodiesterase (5'-nucleotidase family)
VTLGNHEFDFGAARTQELMDISNFKWFGSNVRNSIDRTLFHNTIDVDYIDIPYLQERCIRIGLFGVCTQATPSLSNPTDAVIFEDVIEHAARCVQLLKEKHFCNLVIAVTHLPIEQDKLVAEIPGVDYIVGGHDHEIFLLEYHRTLIVKCGQNLEHLGVLDIDFDIFLYDDGTPQIETTHSFQLLSTKNVSSDVEIDEIISTWKSKPASNRYSKDLDHSHMASQASHVPLQCRVKAGTRPLSTKTLDVRLRESAFPCLVSDALVHSYRSRGFRCDFAVQNGGFVRGDASYAPGTIITNEIISEELPFPRTALLLSMKGSDVWLALEQMLGGDDPSKPTGCFPHLSNGIKAGYDIRCPPLKRVTFIEVNDNAIELEKTYFVAVSAFYAKDEGGDGISAFLNHEIIAEHGQLIRDVVVSYLQEVSVIDSSPPGRLIKL